MKALTVQQMYASLIMSGHKQFETRSKPTKHRGELAIHAAKAPQGSAWDRHLNKWGQMSRSLGLNSCSIHEAIHAPYGTVLGIVNVVDCVPVITLDRVISKQEFELGYYWGNWYAWKLEVVKVFEYPEPAKGQLGLWSWELPEVVKG